MKFIARIYSSWVLTIVVTFAAVVLLDAITIAGCYIYDNRPTPQVFDCTQINQPCRPVAGATAHPGELVAIGRLP
jgi:hypothetical protein